MVQATIEYKGGVYLSQPYKVDILIPLLASAGRLLGADLFQLVAAQNSELAAVVSAVPPMQFPDRKSARAELVEILGEIFPQLPAAEYISEMTELLVGLTAIASGLNAEAEEKTSIEATSDNPESGDGPIVAIEPEPACPIPIPSETVVVAGLALGSEGAIA
jgi:hypothetical protein